MSSFNIQFNQGKTGRLTWDDIKDTPGVYIPEGISNVHLRIVVLERNLNMKIEYLFVDFGEDRICSIGEGHLWHERYFKKSNEPLRITVEEGGT